MRGMTLAGCALLAAALAAADPVAPPGVEISSILFWTPQQQESGYRSIEEIFPTRVVEAGGKP